VPERRFGAFNDKKKALHLTEKTVAIDDKIPEIIPNIIYINPNA
jgi:hypothetical protein